MNISSIGLITPFFPRRVLCSKYLEVADYGRQHMKYHEAESENGGAYLRCLAIFRFPIVATMLMSSYSQFTNMDTSSARMTQLEHTLHQYPTLWRDT